MGDSREYSNKPEDLEKTYSQSFNQTENSLVSSRSKLYSAQPSVSEKQQLERSVDNPNKTLDPSQKPQASFLPSQPHPSRRPLSYAADMDQSTKLHWGYNSGEDANYYLDHRVLTDKVYRDIGPLVPFKEICDDLNIRGLQHKRHQDLAEKIKDIGDMLDQGYIGGGPNSQQLANPYYDNSIQARLANQEGGQRLEDPHEMERAILRKEYDDFDLDTEELRKNQVFDMPIVDPSANHEWFLRK